MNNKFKDKTEIRFVLHARNIKKTRRLQYFELYKKLYLNPVYKHKGRKTAAWCKLSFLRIAMIYD